MIRHWFRAPGQWRIALPTYSLYTGVAVPGATGLAPPEPEPEPEALDSVEPTVALGGIQYHLHVTFDHVGNVVRHVLGSDGDVVWIVQRIVQRRDGNVTYENFPRGQEQIVGRVRGDGSIEAFEQLELPADWTVPTVWTTVADLQEACRNEAERRAFDLLLDRLTKQQRKDLLGQSCFTCVSTPQPYARMLGLAWDLRVVARTLRGETQVGLNICNADDKAGRRWLCIHPSTSHLPWPDRLLAYKLALEDGSIWNVPPGFMGTPVSV